MNDLQEQESQELNQLSSELSQLVAQSVSDDGTSQQHQLDELIKEDTMLEQETTNEIKEINHLINTHLQGRMELEKKLESKRRTASTKLKIRLATIKKKLKERGEDGEEEMNQLYDEEIRENLILDKKQRKTENELWNSATSKTRGMIEASNASNAALQDDLRQSMSELKAKHKIATDDLNRSLLAKQRQKKADLKKRIAEKKKRLEAQNLSKEELEEKEEELEQEEEEELDEISSDTKHELQQLMNEHMQESDATLKRFEDKRVEIVREKRAKAEEDKQRSALDVERFFF